MSMLVWLAFFLMIFAAFDLSPLTLNSVYKLQFFTFIFALLYIELFLYQNRYRLGHDHPSLSWLKFNEIKFLYFAIRC